MDKFLKAINPLRLTLIYTLSLIIVTALTSYFSVFISSNTLLVDFIRFTTSPINSYFEQDYINNIGVTFIILAISELYFTIINNKRVIKIGFVSAILSSYIVSADVFFLDKLPSAGSSIVGSTILLMLTFYIGTVAVNAAFRFFKRSDTKGMVIDCLIVIFALFFGGLTLSYYYGAYIEANNGALLHLLGLFGFSLFFIYIKRTKFFRNKR